MLGEGVTLLVTRICEIVAFVAIGVLLVAFIIGVFKFRKFGSGFRYFLGYMFIVILIEFLAKFLVYIGEPMDNLLLLYPYLVTEFLFISLTYRAFLKLQKRQLFWFNVYWISVTFGLVVYSLIMLLSPNALSAEEFQLYPKTLVNGSILAYAMMFLVRTLKYSNVGEHQMKSFLLINSGVLLYFSGSFIVFLMLNFLVNTSLSVSVFFFLSNAVLALLFYSFCLWAIWKYKQKPVNS